MKTIEAGHVYELPNQGNPTLNQAIKFVQTHKDAIVNDGTTVVEVLATLIDKLEYDDTFEPSYENVISITLLKSALNHQLNKVKPTDG